MINPSSPSEFSENYYFYERLYLGFGGNIGISAFYNKYSFTLSCDISSISRLKVYPDICMFFSLGYNF